jgi:hypothetical protein
MTARITEQALIDARAALILQDTHLTEDELTVLEVGVAAGVNRTLRWLHTHGHLSGRGNA